MSAAPPPLRFLAAIVGLWVCARAAVLAPDWWIAGGSAASPAARAERSQPVRPVVAPPTAAVAFHRAPESRVPRRVAGPLPVAPVLVGPSPHSAAIGMATGFFPGAVLAPPAILPLRQSAPPSDVPRAASRWSASAWGLVRRDGDSAALAPGGTLAGSQAGARLRYRLNADPSRPLSLSARLYAPLRRSGAEAALGLDWRPLRQLPLNLLVERRQALGEDGRSDFAVTLYGGGSARLPAGLRLDGYAQAGAVGLESRDLFADGSAWLGLPLGRLEVGAGAWGAAQPGAARLDAGPSLAVRLPTPGGDLRLQADWRFRLAGDAAPGSGPAITLSTDF